MSLNDLITDVIVGTLPSQQSIEESLTELCDDYHSGDCQLCPVYEANDDKVPYVDHPRGGKGCACLKNGKKMREFILAKM